MSAALYLQRQRGPRTPEGYAWAAFDKPETVRLTTHARNRAQAAANILEQNPDARFARRSLSL